jgi:hypothetical protein
MTESSAFAFRVLGPLHAPGIDHETRPQARAVLAYLLLHLQETHKLHTIADVLPARHRTTEGRRDDEAVVRVAISGCRKLLDGVGTIERSGTSFRLEVDEELIDRTHFARLLDQAKVARLDHDLPRARRLLRRARDLWRGDEALPEFEMFPVLAEDARSVTRSLGDALKRLYEIELALEGPEAMHMELGEVAKRHADHAPLVRLAMQAHCECRQPALAKALYQKYARRIPQSHPDHDLELRDLHHRIVSDEPVGLPTLADAAVRGPTGATASARAAWEFPEDLEDRLAGRKGPPATLDQRLQSPEGGDTSREAVASVLSRLRSWTQSEELLGLLDAWDPDDPLPRPQGETDLDFFEDLKRTSEAWNFRHYRHERWRQEVADRGDDFHAQVIHAAEALRMREATVPVHERYDLGIALGGARISPLARTIWLDLLTTRCQIDAAAFAASLRPIDDEKERPHTTYADEDAETEFDLMHGALFKCARHLARGSRRWSDEAEELEADRQEAHGWWGSSLVRRYDVPVGSRPLYGFAGPSGAPRTHRPRTPDTLEFLWRTLEGTSVNLAPGARVLLVTSAIYVPYQQIEAVRVLGLRHGLEVETVAHPREWTAPSTEDEMENIHRVGNYLQEMRSAIEACQRLAEEHVVA